MPATLAASPAEKLIHSAIVSVGDIATLPEVTIKIIHIVENPKSTARDLHDVIRNDPALAARLLKVVNSAFYGLPGQIASVDRAVVLLGLSAVKNIAIAASMTHMFNSGVEIEGLDGADAWRHAIAVAVACRLITHAQGKPSMEESFLAGLIHDLGILVERQVFPGKLQEVIRRHQAEGGSFCNIEQQVIGADHQAFGMALATKWRFPAHLCTAIGYHHRPLDVASIHRELPILVHVADVLACRAQLGFCATASGEEFDDRAIQILKLDSSHLDEIATKLPEQVALTESIFAG